MDLAAGIPTKFTAAFNLPSGGFDGFLALELGVNAGPDVPTWKSVLLGS